MTMRRIQGAVGAVAAALIVGLIAVLLLHNAPGNGGAGSGPKAHDKTPHAGPATPKPGATPAPLQYTALLQPAQLPVVAPSDPRVVYQLGQNALMRSSDGGVHYSSLALPNTGMSQVDSYGLAVSPLDANHVFISAAGKFNGQGCAGPQSPYPVIAIHGGIMASGYIPCVAQYVSVNGGRTWSKPHLPTPGALGGRNNYRAMAGPYDDQAYVFQAQGSRLYAAMAFASLDGSLVDSLGVRLVASDDGGLTWRFVDTTLATSQRYVCDFGAAPTGSVVYAVTGDNECENMGPFPNISLWRSDNGGQSWRRLGPITTDAQSGLFVTAQGALYSYMPNLTQQGHGASVTGTQTSVMVSVDGGLHFTPAPSAGIPSGDTPWHVYGTLPDGSVIFGAGPAVTNPNGGPPESLYTWKKGQSAWKPIGSQYPGGVAAVAIPAASAGQQSIIITDYYGNVLPLTLSGQ
ncbi:MAG: exo-alpha-sialidase [Chloroflexota bacterium]|nr:exo-alpha-sialidase [Chloroflexota bacterium]